MTVQAQGQSSVFHLGVVRVMEARRPAPYYLGHQR